MILWDAIVFSPIAGHYRFRDKEYGEKYIFTNAENFWLYF